MPVEFKIAITLVWLSLLLLIVGVAADVQDWSKDTQAELFFSFVGVLSVAGVFVLFGVWRL